MQIEAMQYYRLVEPEWPKALGQGEKPKGLTLSRGNHSLFLPWGAIVRASHHVDPENELGRTDSDPMMLRVAVIERHRALFEEL